MLWRARPVEGLENSVLRLGARFAFFIFCFSFLLSSLGQTNYTIPYTFTTLTLIN